MPQCGLWRGGSAPAKQQAGERVQRRWQVCCDLTAEAEQPAWTVRKKRPEVISESLWARSEPAMGCIVGGIQCLNCSRPCACERRWARPGSGRGGTCLVCAQRGSRGGEGGGAGLRTVCRPVFWTVSDRLETLGAGEGLPPGLQRGRHARVSGECNPLGQL